MKFSTLLLAGSIGLNAALAAIVLTGASASPGASRSAATDTAAVEGGPARAGAKAAAAVAKGDTPWKDLETDNPAESAARLAAAGFSPAQVRAIVSAQIRESYLPRLRALSPSTQDVTYWKNPVADPKTQAAQRALNKEMTDAIRAALGPDPDNIYAAELRRQGVTLPPDKIDQIAAINLRYAELRSEASRVGGLTPADQAKLRELDQAMRADIAAALTPQELEDYDLRTSNASQTLRNNLLAFDATEEEFRALHRLQTVYSEKTNLSSLGIVGGSLTPEQSRAMSDALNGARKEMDEGLKTIFTPDRLAEYQRKTDSTYRQAFQLVSRLQLPPATADRLFDLQKELQPQVSRITRENPAGELRNQQLTALETQAASRVTALLGPSGYEAYKEYGGTWLQNIANARNQPSPGGRGAPPPR